MNRKQERELAKKYCLYVEEGLSHDVNLWSHSIGSGEYVKIVKERIEGGANEKAALIFR